MNAYARSADVTPFSSVSDLEFDLLISSNFANNKFLPNCYSMNDDYFSPHEICKLACNNQNKSLLIPDLYTRSLAQNKKLIEEFITEIDFLPEMVGISETKLNVNTCLNLNIPFYDFFSP